MEASYSSEAVVPINQTTWRYNR